MRQISRMVASLVAVAVVGTSAFVVVAAPDDKAAPAAAQPAAADKGGEKAAGKKTKVVRLVKPWKDMTSLSDDQKQQIADIHKKALAEIKQVQQRELDSVLAVLTEQQKTEYNALVAKDTAERKMKKPDADATDEKKTATEAKPEKAG